MMQLDKDYWNNRFESLDTPWDIGSVSPALQAYIDQLSNKNIAILIPGCGNGYEAEYLLKNGFTSVTLIDISSTLTKMLENRLASYLENQLKIITGNFFELKGKFDLVIEQTFFCAIEPALRNDYVQHMHQLLKEHGKIAGVLFNKTFEMPGPAFGGSVEEYRLLFNPLFIIKTMETCYNSIAPRKGSECFFIVIKK